MSRSPRKRLEHARKRARKRSEARAEHARPASGVVELAPGIRLRFGAAARLPPGSRVVPPDEVERLVRQNRAESPLVLPPNERRASFRGREQAKEVALFVCRRIEQELGVDVILSEHLVDEAFVVAWYLDRENPHEPAFCGLREILADAPHGARLTHAWLSEGTQRTGVAGSFNVQVGHDGRYNVELSTFEELREAVRQARRELGGDSIQRARIEAWAASL